MIQPLITPMITTSMGGEIAIFERLMNDPVIHSVGISSCCVMPLRIITGRKATVTTFVSEHVFQPLFIKEVGLLRIVKTTISLKPRGKYVCYANMG